MSTKTFSADILALAQILKCKPLHVASQLAFLGKVLEYCGRCGGEGRYSFNQIDGDVCYGCAGRGRVMPKKVTHEQMEEVRAAVESGAMVPYLRQQEARALARTARQQALKVWGETRVSKVNEHIFGADLARERNSQMHYLYTVVETVAVAIERQTATPSDMEAFTAEFPALLQRFTALDLTEEEAAQCAAETRQKKAEWKASLKRG